MVVAIVDLAHCGTTMTAGVLERLGVPMVWKHTKPDKLEDLDVIGSLQEPYKFGKLVQQRGDAPWGFKYPGAWKYAPTLLEHLPNALYLSIYKDPVSVTMRRFGTISGGKLERTCRWMADNLAGMNASGLQVHCLSYLEAVRKPCTFVARIAVMAGMNVTGGQMDAALEWMKGKR